jgi:hypothetical protein
MVAWAVSEGPDIIRFLVYEVATYEVDTYELVQRAI